MATYSNNLRLTLIGNGEQEGTWGDTTNTNLGTLLEQAISGYVTQVITDGTDTTITTPDGATGVARNMFIECTGSLSANRNLIVPAYKKLYCVFNNTTGGYAVTVKVSGQTGIVVRNGQKMLLVCNGTDIFVATNSVQFTAGSAAVPSISPSGDVDTGIFFPAAEQVGVAITGSEMVRVTSTGMGVGTSPSNRMDVAGTSGGTVMSRVRNTDTGTGGATNRLETGSPNMSLDMSLYNNSGTNGYGILTVGGSVATMYYNCDTQIWSTRAGTERARIDSSGNFGIGATSPLGRLDVLSNADSAQQSYIRNSNAGSSALSVLNIGNNTSSNAFRLVLGSSTNTAWAGADSANLVQALNAPLAFWTNNAERVRILGTGNVGVNTTSPGSTLDVKGTLRLSGSSSGYVGFAPAAAAGSTTYTLPSADGSNGHILTTNGSGTLTWAAPGVSSVNSQTGAVVTTGVDSIGCTMWLICTNTSNLGGVNTTVSGGNLRYGYTTSQLATQTEYYSNTSNTYSGGGTSLSGTWRKMSTGVTWFDDTANSRWLWYPQLYVRIS
jgi:hypothetical protein